MTTITYKDGILAADSRITSGTFIITDDFTKIHKIVDSMTNKTTLCGFCGNASDWEKFLDWDEETDDPLILDNFCAIIIHDDGEITEYESTEEDKTLNRLDLGKLPFYAIGSGREIAIGAMASGKSAIESIEVTKHFDSTTGGVIKSIEFDKKGI